MGIVDSIGIRTCGTSGTLQFYTLTVVIIRNQIEVITVHFPQIFVTIIAIIIIIILSFGTLGFHFVSIQVNNA
ncbi:hypothetical protein NW754_013602 [Fusarium falciforme]|nr:hypothetical protein NW754_013602 [Fusarium falciforme]